MSAQDEHAATRYAFWEPVDEPAALWPTFLGEGPFEAEVPVPSFIRTEELRQICGVGPTRSINATRSIDSSSPDTSQPYFLDLLGRIDEVTAEGTG